VARQTAITSIAKAATLTTEGKSGAYEGVVLLKSIGRAPKAVPTQMDAYTVRSLKRCEQAKGPGYAERIWSRVPNGIVVRNGILRLSD
jgi:hypothetical protein